MRVVWTLGAQEDARDLVARLAAANADAASRLADEFDAAAERLSDFPLLGVSAVEGFRYLVLSRGRYRMIYRVGEQSVRILGITRGAQPWPWPLD